MGIIVYTKPSIGGSKDTGYTYYNRGVLFAKGLWGVECILAVIKAWSRRPKRPSTSTQQST
eukprot:4470898-Pyramimonas_sp.AAC.1